MKLLLPTLAVLGLLALAACGDGGDSSAATGTPAATTTSVAEPASATVTPPGRTPTVPAEAEGPCPEDDAALCNFAQAFDGALRLGQFEAIVSNARISSQTCSGLEQIGPCFGMDEGFVLSGYLVGIDASDGIFYLTGEEYLSLLMDIAEADPAAEDGFGDGAWRLAAVVDEGPDMKVLVTTTIGPDPIYDIDLAERRVFLFRLERADDVWAVSILLTTVFIEQNLNGAYPDGSPVPGWSAWGGDTR